MSDGPTSPIVEFHTEHDFPFPGSENRMQQWLLDVASAHEKSVQSISYALVTDEELLVMNQSHLDHDTYTDILTFPYSYDPIDTEIYISYERVVENASEHSVSTDTELLRVMAHGLLHMCGFDDHSEEDIAAMRAAEDQAIAMWRDK